MKALWLGLKAIGLDFWLYAGVVLVVSLLVGRAYLKYDAAIKGEKAAVQALKDETARITLERAEHKARIAALTVTFHEILDANEAAYRKALHLGDSLLLDAKRELRDARKARQPASRPADAAPAECRTYEADPRLLPERDQDVLLELAAAADRVVHRANRCERDFDEVRAALNAARAKQP